MDTTISAIVILLAVTILLPFLAFLLAVKLLTGKSIRNPEYPPVVGNVFGQLLYFNRIYDQRTEDAKKKSTFRLRGPSRSEVYTVDPRNVEHVLKTSFDTYTKGEYNKEIIKDLFGDGIFNVDGDKWRQQRKLASYEFSTRVLRDFSCSVFRRNAARLVRVIMERAARGVDFNAQDLLMRAGLDSIFKVGFGVELNCLEGSSKEGVEVVGDGSSCCPFCLCSAGSKTRMGSKPPSRIMKPTFCESFWLVSKALIWSCSFWFGCLVIFISSCVSLE